MPNLHINMPNKLQTFLLGTVDSHSALRILRGKSDILRIIWIYACSEWWQLHIQNYEIPELFNPYDEMNHTNSKDSSPIPDLRNHSLFVRKKYFDCPLAVVDTDQSFPPLGCMPDTGEAISINMMPFDLFDPKNTLPSYLHGYLPMIEKCREYNKAYIDMQYNTNQKEHELLWGEAPRKRLDHLDSKNRIAYLTVDERPVLEAGQSQRRGGVHVECPGALRQKEIADKSKYTPDLAFYHPWGLGRAIDEFLIGGIFIASNVSDTTAVWNSRIHDTFGDIIGPHGSLERMREFLGPPAKKLAAGELIWLSDRTPHESLPLHDPTITRQFFRLVVGEIGFWFTEHNTLNPTGFQVPSNVPIIQENKFNLVKGIIPIIWEYGNKDEIAIAYEESTFRQLLYSQGIGFMADELLRNGIYSKETLQEKGGLNDSPGFIDTILDSLDSHYYSTYTKRFITVALQRIAFEYESYYDL